MFGSKNLLVAFVIGTVGLALLFFGVSDVEDMKIGQFGLGMVLLWVSSLFGSFIAGCEVAKKSSDDEKSS